MLICLSDYEQICLKDQDWQPQYAATGNGIAIMANRISYFYNLHGPSMTIDTGCSGSLVSIDLAAQSLRSGQSSLVSPLIVFCKSKSDAFDAGNRCRSWNDSYTKHHHAYDSTQLPKPRWQMLHL